MSTLFISHSSQDHEQAEELNALLVEKGYGWRFLDFDPEQGIQAGASWERTLYTKLRACRAVVALCTDNYLDSKWCFAEVALARMEGKKIFALQLDPWSETTQMPSILTEDQFIDLRQDREAGLERLWLAFEAAGIVPEQNRKWRPDDPPYPGLRAFEESDEPIFFGREKEVAEGAELLSRVQRQGHPRMVMVLGASGSGKSSLARAGILPHLRRDPERWLVVGPFRPGRDPAAGLAAALAAAFDAVGKPVEWEEIHRRLDRPARRISETAEAPPSTTAHDRLLVALSSMERELSGADAQVAESLRQLKGLLSKTREAPAPVPAEPRATVDENPLLVLADRLRLAKGPSEATVVLVIDQLEELLGHDEQGAGHPANRFLELLRDGCEAEDSPVLVLATMRSDFLDAFQRCPALVGVGFASLSVGPMPRDGMRQVIEQPARLGGIELEPGLTDLLLDDTGSSDALPLLAFTLREMWNRYRQDLLLSIEEYKALGGLHGAVAQVADETLEAALRLGREEDLRDAFLRLARPTAEGSGWSRRPASWNDLTSKTAELGPMLQSFVDQRLLVRREDGTVEVAHEALFRSWDTLAGWLSASSEGLRLLGEIRTEAEKWDREPAEEREPYLLRGGRLARALELRAGGMLSLEDLEKRFVEASEAAERARTEAEEARHRRELRQARLVARVVGIAFLVVAGLGLWAWAERQKAERERRVATAGRLASLAVSRLETELDLALLLSVEAVSVLPTAEAVDALSTALHHSPRLIRRLRGHEKHAVDVAFSPNGEVLASASYDATIRLWDPSTGRLSKTLTGHESDVNGIAFNPDGTILATTSDDTTIRLWDVAEGTLHRLPLEGHDDAVNSVAFSPDGKWLASASEDETIRIWDVAAAESSRPVKILPSPGSCGTVDCHTGEIRSVAFSPDGEWLASAADDGKVILWEVATGSGQMLGGPGGGHGPEEAREVAFSPDGTLLASAGRDDTVRFWGFETREQLEEPLEHVGGAQGLAFSPGGEHLAVARSDGEVWLWNVGSRQVTARLRGHTDKTYRVEFSRDGKLLASASRDKTVALWTVADLRSPDPSRDDTGTIYPRPLEAILRGHDSGVAKVAFSPADGDLLASASYDKTIRLWDVASLEARGKPLLWHSDSVVDVEFSPDGKLLVSAGNDGKAMIWDVETQRPKGTVLEHEHAIESVTFSRPDGRLVATAGRDRTVRLWEAASGRPIGEPLAGHGDEGVTSVAFQPGGTLLASGSNQAEEHPSKDPTLLLWDVESRTLAGDPLLGHTDGVTQVVFSPDGGRLVTAGFDRTVRSWDVASRQGRVLDTQPSPVLDVAVSTDGTRVATAGYDGWIHVWDLDKDRSLGFEAHDGVVESVAFSPDGRRLASAGYDGTIRLWAIDESAWPDTACRAASRNFSLAEWNELVGKDVPYQCVCPELPAGAGAPDDGEDCPS